MYVCVCLSIDLSISNLAPTCSGWQDSSLAAVVSDFLSGTVYICIRYVCLSIYV